MNDTKLAVDSLSQDNRTPLENPVQAVDLAGVIFCPPPLDAGPPDECIDLLGDLERIFHQFNQNIWHGNVYHCGALVSEFCRVADDAIAAREAQTMEEW